MLRSVISTTTKAQQCYQQLLSCRLQPSAFEGLVHSGNKTFFSTFERPPRHHHQNPYAKNGSYQSSLVEDEPRSPYPYARHGYPRGTEDRPDHYRGEVHRSYPQQQHRHGNFDGSRWKTKASQEEAPRGAYRQNHDRFDPRRNVASWRKAGREHREHPSLAEDRRPGEQDNEESSRQNQPNHEEEKAPMLSSWISLENVGVMMTLEDVIGTIQNVIHEVASSPMGIVDLESHDWEGGDAPLPTVTNIPDEIAAAHVVLSPLGRPKGWMLNVGSPSIAHAIMERHKRDPVMLANWKRVTMMQVSDEAGHRSSPWKMRNEYLISDHVVRVENCTPQMTVDYMRHIFARYHLATDGPTVMPWESDHHHHRKSTTYIIRFADASWARAAMREQQGVVIHDRPLLLIQYPRQIVGAAAAAFDDNEPATSLQSVV